MILEEYKEKLKWVKNERGYNDGYIKIKVPSVSTILGTVPDPEFDQWKIDMGDKAEEILQSAAHRGTAMHCYLEEFVKELTKTKDKTKSINAALQRSHDILTKDNIPLDKISKGRNMFYNFYYSDYPDRFKNVIATELKLYSETYLFRGALDVMYKDNGIVISDFKSSSSFLKSGSIKEYKYKLQLGAYAIMFEDIFKGKKVSKSSIICISTNSDSIQEIYIDGEELNKYKNEFITWCIKWHNENNQGYLFYKNLKL